MNAFEKHGITHLSASSLRLYRDQPGAWVCRYLLRIKDDAGPGAWRGQAVEAGLDRLMFGADMPTAIAAMQDEFEVRAAGLADDKTVKERGDLCAYLTQAQMALASAGVPLTRQSRISIDLPGLDVPIIGYADWMWDKIGRDLKTTQRLPSYPSPAHVEQVAIYAKATGKPFELVYVTPKKSAIYPVSADMAADAMVRVRRGAMAIKSLLERVEDGRDALSIFSPDYTSYEWSAEMVLAANKIFEGVAA